MRLQGNITRWNDDKGFGFIAWHGDGTLVFVHIKAFIGTTRRPVVGDIVSYEIGKDPRGRSRAEKVRFAGQPPVPRHSARAGQSRSRFPVLFTWMFLLGLIAAAYMGRIPWLIVAAYISASLITFFAYAWDKSSAQLGNWRTKESTLHLMALVCGWPGALAGQRLLRHKSSKEAFQSVFWFVVLLNVLVMAFIVWSGASGPFGPLLDSLWSIETR
tara:strand:- start:1624 stop:2268 length:645 start_codon:yes stop_codon:yes gene_type:complete